MRPGVLGASLAPDTSGRRCARARRARRGLYAPSPRPRVRRAPDGETRPGRGVYSGSSRHPADVRGARRRDHVCRAHADRRSRAGPDGFPCQLPLATRPPRTSRSVPPFLEADPVSSCFGNPISPAHWAGDYKLRYGPSINIPVIEHATGKCRSMRRTRVAVEGRGGRFDTVGPHRSPTCPMTRRRGPALLDTPAFSVQYTPRLPGPHDAADLFDRFTELI